MSNDESVARTNSVPSASLGGEDRVSSPQEKRKLSVENPSATDLIMAAKRRQMDMPIQKPSVSTPDYSALYGDDEATPHSSPLTTPTVVRSTVVAMNAQPHRKPRYTRRNSITKFSLQMTALVAVRQLHQEDRNNERIESSFSSGSRKPALQYRDIAPILDKAMAEIASNCF